MGVKKHEVTAGPRADPGTHLLQKAVPCLPSAVVHADQIDLPQMDGFDPDIDIGADQEHEPQLRLDTRDVRHAGSRPPLVHVFSTGIEHLRIIETALLDGQSQRLESPGGHGDLADLAVNRLEGRGLEDHVRIEGVHTVDQRFGPGPEIRLGKRLLIAPAVDRPADELGAGVADELHVGLLVGIGSVVAVGIDGQELRHRDGPRKVAVQHVPGDRTVEAVGIRLRGAACARAGGKSQRGGKQYEQSFHGRYRHSFHNLLMVSSVERPVGHASLCVLQR